MVGRPRPSSWMDQQGERGGSEKILENEDLEQN